MEQVLVGNLWNSRPYSRAILVAGLGLVVAGASYSAWKHISSHAFEPSPPANLSRITQDGGHALQLKDGRAVEFFIFGCPSCEAKSNLLVIPGAMCTGRLTIALLDDWAKRAKVSVVSPSLPGFGESEHKTHYSLEDWVSDAISLLDHLGIKQTHLIGTSFGSIHAAALASIHPERIQNVLLHVAFSPFDPREHHDPLQGSDLEIFAKLRRYPLLKRLVEKYVFLPMMRVKNGATSDVTRAIATRWEGFNSAPELLYAPWNFDWESLAANQRKVIVVSGTKDTMAPSSNQKRLARRIKGSELVEYVGGHEMALQKEGMLVELVEMLLEKKQAGSG